MSTGLSERGGIVARGILLDYVRYAEKHGIVYDPCTSHPIHLAQLKEMIEEENLEVRPGDILIVRTGMSKWNLESEEGDVGPYVENTHIGVNPTPELLEWIWDNNFAAVGSDAIAFEVIPAPKATTDKCTFSFSPAQII
jgi:kynurenine formamidase